MKHFNLIYINQVSPYIKINSQNREYSLELLKDNYAFNNAFYISLGYRAAICKMVKNSKDSSPRNFKKSLVLK